MTHHPIRILEDGTRVYSNYTRYKPIALEKRKYGINKPDDPRAVRFENDWYLPLELVSDEERTMPETIPDAETLEHRARCLCEVCRRPGASDMWRRARQRRPLRSKS